MFSLLLADKAEWYLWKFETPFDAFRTVAIWVTLLFAAAFVVCSLLLKGERGKKFLKYGFVLAVIYACLLSIIFLVWTFVEDGIVDILFYPITVSIVCVAASALAIAVKNTKTVKAVCCCVVGAAVLAVLVCVGIHFASGDGAEMNWITNADVNTVGLYVSAAVLIAFVCLIAFLFDNGKSGFDTKSVSYAAICISMSFALSYLRVVKMPQGGSITVASLLPLMVYSYMFGIKKGVFAGAIYGLLQAVQDPYIIHPAQFVLDYPLAFSCIGLSGIFANLTSLKKYPQLKFALGAVLAGAFRFLMHFISGMFAFGAFAAEGQEVWAYSFIYQAGYVLPDIAIVVLAGVLAFSSKSFVKVVSACQNLQTSK